MEFTAPFTKKKYFLIFTPLMIGGVIVGTFGLDILRDEVSSESISHYLLPAVVAPAVASLLIYKSVNCFPISVKDSILTGPKSQSSYWDIDRIDLTQPFTLKRPFLKFLSHPMITVKQGEHQVVLDQWKMSNEGFRILESLLQKTQGARSSH